MALCGQAAAAGSNARFAIVVGNNHGHTDAAQLKNLLHAEREARRLRDHLVDLGNFDRNRVELLTGASRQQILDAADRLAKRHAEERKALGDTSTLFAFFFTGHGLGGELLTATDPITSEDLRNIFATMDATLTLGFFDACYAGQLDIHSKGAVATPGFNPIEALPREILNAQGTMWFVSSQPDELSYEDEKLGGLLTHFFIEAFTLAETTGVGVPLENMWEYARSRTRAHAARFGRTQTPAKLVRQLEARGPLYLSFPKRRTASLAFDAAIDGEFLVQYEQGALVEKVTKAAGSELELPMYPGPISVVAMDTNATISLTLPANTRVRIQPEDLTLPKFIPGQRDSPIREKGELPGLLLTIPKDHVDLGLGAHYGLSLSGADFRWPTHYVGAHLWGIYGSWTLNLEASYGYGGQDLPSWSFAIDEIGARAYLGYGWNLGHAAHLEIDVGAGPSWQWTSYNSGRNETSTTMWLGSGLRLFVPIPTGNPVVVAEMFAGVGHGWSQQIAARDTHTYGSFQPFLTFGLARPLSAVD
ncbi:MAG: hypothetical protein A2289_07390 [Deltaproteobacteria bacterium RIFOXYA12_FULL_58_15]|nr:MAG: hypothetical protein A2289_07390 [Deltaproteobacteria bacterium RIFOXYA12_FULL_58_15]OGR12626.1 MAG: hypothetical protein A2341_20335 [Deltaproteobacteria bacterium RIFOXYB12_FULL_58_9]